MVSKSLCLLLLLISNLAWSQVKDSIVSNKKDLSYVLEDQKWRIQIPIWIPGFRGSFAYGGLSLLPEDGDQDVEDRISDSSLKIEFYLIGNLRFQHKKFFVGADGFNATLGSSLVFTNLENIEFLGTIDGMVLRGVAGYKVFESIKPQRLFKWSIFAYAGVRYYKLHIFTNRIGVIDIKPTWAEPLVGVEIPVVLKRWRLLAKADYGGFGIDNHNSWSVSSDASYSFSKLFALGLGWSVLDFNYDQQFEFKYLNLGIQLTGPYMKLQFSF